MRTLLVLLYIVAAVAPALGLLLVIVNTKKIIEGNDSTNRELLRIQDEVTTARKKLTYGSPEYEQSYPDGHRAYIEAGAKNFDETGGIPSMDQLSFAPNFIENMILKRLISRFPTEIILIVFGLICGAVASIWSLFLP